MYVKSKKNCHEKMEIQVCPEKKKEKMEIPVCPEQKKREH
jgi:hypothetical protein